MKSPTRISAGFTLIEAIVAIVITGILSAIVATFIARPVQSYADSVRRAELTDAADVALRRIARDVRKALPNSLRTVAGGFEFIMTDSGGRYRDAGDGSTGGNALGFTPGSGTDFDVLGPMPTLTTGANGDYIVVYNLGPTYGPANAYDCTLTPPGCNIAQVASLPAASTVRMASNVFAAQTPPLPSPGSRFQVVRYSDRVVRYTCTAGVLTRWSGCSIATPSVCSGSGTVLAGGGTQSAACPIIDYTTAALGRSGVLSIKLTITDTTSSSEAITLVHQLHVDNAP